MLVLVVAALCAGVNPAVGFDLLQYVPDFHEAILECRSNCVKQAFHMSSTSKPPNASLELGRMYCSPNVKLSHPELV